MENVKIERTVENGTRYTIGGVTYHAHALLGYSDYSGSVCERANVETIKREIGDWHFIWYSVLSDLERGHVEAHVADIWREAKPLIVAEGTHGTTQLLINEAWEEWPDTESALADYPVLDDCELSRIELEQQEEAWIDWARADFLGAVVRVLGLNASDDVCDWVAFEVDEDLIRETFNAAIEATGEEWINEPSGPFIRIEPLAKHAAPMLKRAYDVEHA